MLKSAVNNVVAGTTGLSFQEALYKIRQYHAELGWPAPTYDINHGAQARVTMEQHRVHCLAMAAECMEVLNAAPWKPWKDYNNYPHLDELQKDVAEELIDVLCFIGAISEIWHIAPSQLEFALQSKLQKNKERITNGYNCRNHLNPKTGMNTESET